MPFRSEDEADWHRQVWRITKIVKWRRVPGGKRQALCRWAGVNKKTGLKWDDSWEPEDNLTSDQLEEAGTHAGIAELSEEVGPLNIAPLVFVAIKAFARVLTLAKTACRPKQHKFLLDMLRLEVLAMAFFEVVTRLCGGKANVEVFGDGKQLKIKTMAGVDKFLQLQKYLDTQKAIGALRFDIGRASNTDMMVVGIPILFTWKPDAQIPGLGTLKAEIATVHINGDDGHLDYPSMQKGMLTKEKHREAVRAYVKATIPATHPLRDRARWHLLPPFYDTLAIPLSQLP